MVKLSMSLRTHWKQNKKKHVNICIRKIGKEKKTGRRKLVAVT